MGGRTDKGTTAQFRADFQQHRKTAIMSKTPNYLAEGTWPCTVLSAECGEDKGLITVRINVKIDDGPSKGRQCSYEDRVDAKSAPYVARSCKGVGWSGKLPLVETFVPDVEKWIKATGGKSTVQIRYVDIKRGKKYDEWFDEWNAWKDGGKVGDPPQAPIWDKVQSIGAGPKPLAAASKTAAQDADEYLSRALADEGSAPPPTDDAPHAAEMDPDSIPFITSSWLRVDGGVL